MMAGADRPDAEFVLRSNDTLERMVDRFAAAIAAHKSASHLDNLRSDLKAFLSSHLDIEHCVMAAHNYPLIKPHMEDHVELKTRFMEIMGEPVTAATAPDFVARLRELHDRHVHAHDDVLCRFLADRYAFHAVEDGLGI